MSPLPTLREFRTERTYDGILHLVFDMPGRSMNVFTNAAIHEIRAFASWLEKSDVRGVVVRSGKPTAFCAGADLTELGVAYDMIMAAPRGERSKLARDHFAPIGRAFRALETADKPIAVAISGLALGGGCEFALGCHYRILTDTPQTALGLPESLVGLFPGGGGTQRLPRLVGIANALPILLEGARLSPGEAVRAGAAHEVVAPGTEIEAAERWIRSNPHPHQPWDRRDWAPVAASDASAIVAAERARVLHETNGHYPAPLAILDCLERGLPESMDTALSIELELFAGLIQRPEPRNMIQTLFIGKQDYDKRRKADALPAELETVKRDVAASLAAEAARVSLPEASAIMRRSGFTKAISDLSDEAGRVVSSPSVSKEPGGESAGLWFEAPRTDEDSLGARLLAVTAAAASVHAGLSAADKRLTDYAIVRDLGFPAYLGGPFALLSYLGSERLNQILET